jgi:hypothetical protein
VKLKASLPSLYFFCVCTTGDSLHNCVPQREKYLYIFFVSHIISGSCTIHEVPFLDYPNASNKD